MTRRHVRSVLTVAAAVLVALVTILGPIDAAGAQLPPPDDANFGRDRIFWLLNEERRIHGLPPVGRNAGADHIAQYSANIQAWFGRLGHNPNLGRDVTERVGNWYYVGENVGCGGDADNLHGMWMRSAGHARNALHGSVDTVGIGYVYARGCAWATVVFIDT